LPGALARSGQPPRARRRAYGPARADGIPHARVLHDASRARVHARAASRSHLGRQRLRGGAHHRCAHPPPSQSAGGIRVPSFHPDRGRRGISRLLAHGVKLTAPRFAMPKSVATQAWWFAAGRLLATVAVGLLAGWALGNLWAGLAGTLALYLAWHLAALFRLSWWIRHRSYADPPDIPGV